MNLEELQTTLQELTGRFDLTPETLVRYLNAGQRMLDDMSEFVHAPAEFAAQLTSGDFYVQFPYMAKVITGVGLTDVYGNYHGLVYVPLKDLKALNSTLIGSTELYLPDYYSLGNVRRAPDNEPNALLPRFGVIETGDTTRLSSVIFNCRLDKDYVVEIIGKFYSPQFQLETDVTGETIPTTETWWSVFYPDVLIAAAKCKVDLDYDNTEGMIERLKAIRMEVAEITNNVIEQEIQTVGVMRG